MNRLTFSGHETFHCRHFWLKKGYDFLNEDHKFSDETAVVELGVGKNMVAAIRYWLRAFEITDEEDQFQRIGNYLLGKNGRDPYLEKQGSLWLLHYMLVTRGKASIFSIVFNEFRKERIEFSKEHLKWFIKRKCEETESLFTASTVENDISVFIKSYLRPQYTSKNIEDDFSGLLVDLSLLYQTERTDDGNSLRFKIEGKDREDLPVHIFLFSILTNEKYGNSISFDELLNGYNSVGAAYAMSESGLMTKIEHVIDSFPQVTFTDDAGIRELQFKKKPDKWEILNQYYHEC